MVDPVERKAGLHTEPLLAAPPANGKTPSVAEFLPRTEHGDDQDIASGERNTGVRRHLINDPIL
jgi:hypothetical protein